MSTSSGGLTASPLNPNRGFNWVFLVELIVCGVLSLFFLFYFNRLFATLVSYGLRAWTWHRYRVYIDIQALQISLLGGRVFFKGFKYHGNNETILIHSGFVTWCYWLWNVKELNVKEHNDREPKHTSESEDEIQNRHGWTLNRAEEGGTNVSTNLPCRLSVSLNGVEWFVYNRSAAYDAVIAGMAQPVNARLGTVFSESTENEDSKSRLRKRGKASKSENAEAYSKNSADVEGDMPQSIEKHDFEGRQLDPMFPASPRSSQSRTSERHEHDHTSTEVPSILQFLPVHVSCVKAAVVVGNETTKSVLIIKAEKAEGEIDAAEAKPLDKYRQLINFDFDHPVIQMKPNDDYKEDQASVASRVKRGETNQLDPKKNHIHTHSFIHRQRRKIWHTLQDLVPAFRSSVDSLSSSDEPHGVSTPTRPGSNAWQGLSRYIDDNEQDDKARWNSVEYATVSTIVDSPEATMSYYWDVVGTVPARGSPLDRGCEDDTSNINGDISPEWGLDLSLKGGLINYGPWADRQRADIQRVFFPSLCKDASPSKSLTQSQFRVPTEFKVYIEFNDETTLRVPIREESKNWKWAKQADSTAKQGDKKNRGNKPRRGKADKGATGSEIRPFGWLDVKVGANATVVYSMDMVAGSSGFSNTLDLDLPNTEITTSINHGLLWRSVENRISCDLSNPLQWNGLRTWSFDITTNGLELFILREHIFLLIDLINDWASGPPPEYLTFSPFKYLVNLHLDDFRLYLNVNDSNIINNPSDFDDNTYIIIFGSVLDSNICIPLDTYRPHRNDISFDVSARNGGLNLHVPPWNTQATFLTSTELATLKDIDIKGKYQYCATTSASNTDTLLLTIHGNAPSAHFYGFVIRYFLKIKDNYFGDDIRFKTLEEYQDVLRVRREGRDDDTDRQPHKKSNDLDVILAITADESSVILPANLYSGKEHTRIEIATLAADLRFTNYYMDLDLILSTLAFSLGSEQSGTSTPISATSNTQLFVDGASIYGNRLFGLPPTEPTYVCNWDFAVGAVSGECTMDFFGRLVRGARAFAFSFDDDENALTSISEVILHDVTFLRASVESARVWLHVDEAAFLLSTAEVSINFNDWAGSHYSRKLNIIIPELCFGCVDAESASRHRSRVQNLVETHAFVQTALSVAMIQRKLGFEKDRKLQQEHVKRQDQRTHRAGFLLRPDILDDSMLANTDPPAMCIPPMPTPIHDDIEAHSTRHSIESVKPDKSSLKHLRQFVKRKTSFLSISDSSQKSNSSVLRPLSSHTIGGPSTTDFQLRPPQEMPRTDRQMPLRDVSASTGRRSSLYSAAGDSRGMPPSSVTFSSSYIAPYFPLEAVEPDKKDLPPTPQNLENDFEWREPRFSLEDIHPDRVDENATHTSFIVELSGGLAGVFNPKAVDAVAGLLTTLQANDPIDILDELQIGCGNEILELKKQKNVTSNIVDLNVRVPWLSLRFLNGFPASVLGESRHIHDQYDISMNRLAVTSRSQNTAAKVEESQRATKALTLYLALKSANISAKERYSDTSDPEAAIKGLIEGITCWVASGVTTSAAVMLKGIGVATASSKIEYLASLLHRSDVLATRTAEIFSSLINQQHDRVQLFTYLVTTAGERAADPLFLTRPSYVLRSAPNHLRTSDSWKIVTRLRHMYAGLDASTKTNIARRCSNISESIPENARDNVLAEFDNWRSWDLNDVNASHVMRAIYGQKAAGISQAPGRSRPAKISFRTELIRLVLDPGPKENEISLVNLGLTFEHNVVSLDSQLQSPLDPDVTYITRVQAFCDDISINLNWELYELANDIMELYQHEQPSRTHASPIIPTQAVLKNPGQELHVIVATDKVSITTDTVNIRLISIVEGLKGSFIIIDNSVGQTKTTANLMLAAEAATSKIKNHSQDLTLCQLRFPVIYSSYERQVDEGGLVNSIKFAGNCQELSFVIQQDILVVVEALDLIIGDEIAQLYRLRQRIPATESPQMQPVNPNNKAAHLTKINLALFLNMYKISIPLLQSLTYSISGTVARASVEAHLGSEVIFDFDIKEHSHDVHTSASNASKSISLLQMPPTNGHILLNIPETETMVSVFVWVELIKLDAAAVHSLLTALNRPEISSVMTDVQTDIRGMQTHLDEIFGRTQKIINKDKGKTKPFIYDAHLTLAGFDVFANAHGGYDNPNRARLDFNLGRVQLVLANRLEQNGPILEFPELRVSLRHIMFELSRWNKDGMQPCGNLALAAFLTATSKTNDAGEEVRSFHLKSDALKINLFAETASSVVDVMGDLQTKIKDIDLSREKKYLQKLRKSKPRVTINEEQEMSNNTTGSIIFSSMYSLELLNIQVCWVVGTYSIDHSSQREREDLVLSLKRVDLSTSKKNTARLTIEDLQLQMVPASQDNKSQRSFNSALLPEIVFNAGYVSTADARRLAFQAAGKSLDLRLTSQFMIPGAALRKSISSAADKVRAAAATWSTPTPGPSSKTPRQTFLGSKRMESLLVDAYFAGAVVYLAGKRTSDTSTALSGVRGGRAPQTGRYGQFTQTDTGSNTVLRAPGLASKVEYKDDGVNESSLNAEIKVDASSNIIYPAVVPLIMEISSTVKDIVSDEDDGNVELPPKVSPQRFKGSDEESNILTADPITVLGGTRLNLGFRICRQEFSLSCQPIARVAATARFDSIYIAVNTVRSSEHGHFFAASATFSNLQASVQHVYSRESTGSFEVDSVFLSLMNSKHVSSASGVSAILKISPMKVLVNAKQLQDFLLFREIWVPPEIRQSSPTPAPTTPSIQSQAYLVQRYQQVAATGAFPWNATVSIAELDVQLDLGQAIGKSAFLISNFWISSKKNSDWEQNLCFGFDKVGVDSTGRMSGLVALQDFKVRTSIQWPDREKALNQTPLIQGSFAFSQFRFKAAFDYQAFLIADITSFDFFMYNVRNRSQSDGDHLVAVINSEAVQVFCTTTTASQGLALYQAFLRLAKEKRANYETSLAEIEKFMQRRTVSSASHPTTPRTKSQQLSLEDQLAKSPISLHTDVIVSLKAVNIGAFPNTFSDHQVFKLEALDAQARFAVAIDQGKIHSNLGLTLGQLRIGLAGVKTIDQPKPAGDMSVEDVVRSATGSRGGTILKVPKVEASMQTWQIPASNHIDYIFKSSFEGKVEVGWNYSRISYIRGMWATHSKALAQRLGKPLPITAVKITGVPDEGAGEWKDGEQQKITAEVNVPQSKYDYTALEPPVIETPQLRDMGEATPPLEWIGLHRDRLPNLTHQIVIVTLLELASEVEDAYSKILGSS